MGKTLKAQLLATRAKRKRLIKDCEQIVSTRVDQLTGISGFALRAGYHRLQAAKPDVVYQTIDGILDDLIEMLEPHYETYCLERESSDETFTDFLIANSNQIANQALKFADRKAKKANSSAVATLYRSFRPLAKKQIQATLPALAKILKV